MIRHLLFLCCVFVITLMTATLSQAITITGNVYLNNQKYHTGIKILFQRIAPSALWDSTYTDGSCYYSIYLQPGIYIVTFSKEGYFKKSITGINLYSNQELSDTTLEPHTTRLLVPQNFSTIKDAISASDPGDTVLVSPGTYYEKILIDRDIMVGSLYSINNDSSYISSTIIDGENNGRVVKISCNTGGDVEFEGFTIRNGNQKSTNYLESLGGGIACFGSCNITLKNLRVIANRAARGGGISINEQSVHAVLRDVTISQNTAQDIGGGLFADSPCKLEKCTVTDNGFGGIYFGRGGEVLDSEISRNIIGGGISSDYELTVKRCTFCNNSGDIGGGIRSYNCTIENSLFINNTATSGGGLYYGELDNNGKLILINSSFIGNSAVQHGSSIFHKRDYFSRTDLPFKIMNCIFVDNDNICLYFEKCDNKEIFNCLFWNNDNDIINGPEYIRKNITTNINGDLCDAYGNISCDPQFRDPQHLDFRIMDTSPCIGSGTPDNSTFTDITGATRGTPPDIGAYENSRNKPILLPVLLLNSPNGNERWVAGNKYLITWTQKNITHLNLEFSTNSGLSWNLITSSASASQGSYLWTIPDIDSATCIFRVSDASYPSVSDSSNSTFTIVRPKVTVLSPNGGEIWPIAEQRAITWTSSDIDTVRIEYSVNGGLDWIILTDKIPASDGIYPWTLPNINSQKYLVKITNISGIAVSDVSDGNFKILPETVVLTFPNGGNSLIAGDLCKITWVSTGLTTINLEYSIDGIKWIEIASNLNAQTGSYSWSIPIIVASECFIRISKTSDLTISDQSDFSFSILNPTIILTAPNGGEHWSAKRSLPITWEEKGIHSIKLEYSTDNGNTWEFIAENIEASVRSYTWKVPETLSSNCLLRVADLRNADWSDVSDSVFSILPPPSLRVITPNSGESLRCSATQDITWESERIDSLRIEYTLSGGRQWTTLTQSVPATLGTYRWILPDETSSQANIRIIDISDSSFADYCDSDFYLLRNNLNASFGIDSDINTFGNQGKDHICNVGGSKNVGFTLYAKEWEIASGFTVSFSWNPEKISFRYTSSPIIVDDEITMNGKTFTPEPEANILSGTLLSAGEQSLPGFYTRSFAIQSDATSTASAGLIYFAVFRTSPSFVEADTLSIRCTVQVANEKGLVKDLGVHFFRIIPGLQPPSNFTVSDIPNDQGHSLKLTWAASPSEQSGLVSYYRLYRSLLSTFPDSIRSISSFSGIEAVTAWERHAAVLVDSVAAGAMEYTDTAVILTGVPYFYWIQAVGAGGESAKIAAGFPTMVEDTVSLPSAVRLGEARPNPFNPSTTIEYSLPRDGKALLRVYNVSGQKVATLAEGPVSAGRHSVVWNARGLPSGVYFYSLKTEQGYGETKKALLLK